MKRAIESIMIWFITGAVVIALLLLGHSVYIAHTPPTEHGPRQQVFPAQAWPGDTIKLCRDLIFNREETLRLTWVLLRRDGGVEERVELGNSVAMREPGALYQCRALTLPSELEPGDYSMTTIITWDHGFFSSSAQAPRIQIRVLP